MPSKKNEQMLGKIDVVLKEYKDFFVTQNNGLTVLDLTELRIKLQESGSVYHIVKNNVFRIALENNKLANLDEYLIGSNGILFSNDPIKAAKVIDGFAKEKKEKIALKGGYSEGQVVPEEYITNLASLSSKEDLLAKLIYILQNPVQKLAVAIEAISKQKEEQA